MCSNENWLLFVWTSKLLLFPIFQLYSNLMITKQFIALFAFIATSAFRFSLLLSSNKFVVHSWFGGSSVRMSPQRCRAPVQRFDIDLIVTWQSIRYGSIDSAELTELREYISLPELIDLLESISLLGRINQNSPSSPKTFECQTNACDSTAKNKCFFQVAQIKQLKFRNYRHLSWTIKKYCFLLKKLIRNRYGAPKIPSKVCHLLLWHVICPKNKRSLWCNRTRIQVNW